MDVFSFDYIIGLITNFALLFLHKDNINDYFEEIRIKAASVISDTSIVGYYAKLETARVKVVKSIEEYENNYNNSLKDQPNQKLSNSYQNRQEEIETKKNRISNELYRLLSTYGMQAEQNDFDSFLRGKVKNLKFQRNKSKIFLHNYEFGFILYNINKVFYEFKSKECSIIIYENGHSKLFKYEKLKDALRPFHMDLSKKIIRTDFFIIYQYILNNFN